MERKLYWLIQSNGDLSITCGDLQTCMDLIKSDYDSLDYDDQPDADYSITPVFYTEEEYSKLPEAE